MPETSDQRAAERQMQKRHEAAQLDDPEHDRVSCVCCCFDCDEEWEKVQRAAV